MAMLAEPRRRKRYNLCPRGKALYEDDSRFGTKMLEKMGWSKGRGLGANEDGSQEFVRVRFKNDAEGLGYENRDDQWTTHEEGFNGLLKELNGGAADDDKGTESKGDASASEEESRPMGFGFKAETTEQEKPKTLKENISGVSLEEKSKSSKARVHYKKFTRGKDLAQYSEKDLANIFGKKATDEIDAPVQVTAPPEQAEEEEKPVNPNFGGVQTVSTGLSVNDYFKLKMEALKSKLKNNTSTDSAEPAPPTLNGSEEQQEIEAKEPAKKKKKKDKDQERERECEEDNVVEEKEPPKKKKKKSKHAEQDAVDLQEVAIETASQEKKKKKSKRAAEEVSTPPDPPGVEVELTDAKPATEKKSKRAKKDADEVEEAAIETVSQEKKKKKSKRGVETVAEVPESAEPEKAVIQVELPEEKPADERKYKRAAAEQEDITEMEQPAVETEDINPSKRKKKKKNKQEDSEDAKATPEQTAENEPKKKKKSKKNEETQVDKPQEKEQAEKKTLEIEEKEEEIIELKTEAEAKVAIAAKKKTKKNDGKPKKPEKPTKDKVKSQKHKSNVSAKSDTPVELDSDTSVELDPDLSKYLTYEQLIEQRDSFNICTISSFCAEKFHIFDMKAFRNSTLPQIPGYSTDENIQLNVVQTKNDALRIVNLWDGNTSKYTREQPDVSNGSNGPKRTKHKAAVRAIKRRQVFSGI